MSTKLVNPSTALMSDERLERAIRAQQDIQRRNPQSSMAWQDASDVLAGLFHEAKVRKLQMVSPL